jgi:hypothetical protein
MQGSENAALSNLGRNKTYDSTNAVYFFPLKCKRWFFRDLWYMKVLASFKIKTNNPELNVTKEVYNNFLSYYAL